MTNTSNTPGYRIPDDKLGSVGIALEHAIGVFHVVTESRDLKVLKPVVGFNPVLVIDSHLVGNPNESFGYKPVRVPRIFSSCNAQNELFISIGRVNVPPKNPRLLALVSDYAPHATIGADLVPVKVIDLSPLFHTCNPTMGYMQ